MIAFLKGKINEVSYCLNRYVRICFGRIARPKQILLFIITGYNDAWRCLLHWKKSGYPLSSGAEECLGIVVVRLFVALSCLFKFCFHGRVPTGQFLDSKSVCFVIG